MLTPSERRGAIVVALLLVLGAGHDLWRVSAHRPTRIDAAALGVAPRDSIPSRAGEGGSPAQTGKGAVTGTSGTPTRSISLNHADAAELERLPGIGPVLAGRIVAHREAHGPFHRIEDLLAVRGIGPRLLERLRTHVVIEG